MQRYNYKKGNNHVLLHVPHSSITLTQASRDSLLLSDKELMEELLHMTDTYTDEIAYGISEKIATFQENVAEGNEAYHQVNILVNNLSRLVVDPERFPDEREEMNKVGMGAVYTHGYKKQRIREDDEDFNNLLIEQYFTPYAQAVEDTVTGLVGTFDQALIVDMHSYSSVALPYELHQDDSRPEICIGADDYHTNKEQVDTLKRIIQFYGYEVAINSPFSGTYVPLKHYGNEKRVSSIMLEIRRDLYMDEKTGVLEPIGYQYLVATLADAIDALSAL